MVGDAGGVGNSLAPARARSGCRQRPYYPVGQRGQRTVDVIAAADVVRPPRGSRSGGVNAGESYCIATSTLAQQLDLPGYKAGSSPGHRPAH
jgi:hypothetical protein